MSATSAPRPTADGRHHGDRADRPHRSRRVFAKTPASFLTVGAYLGLALPALCVLFAGVAAAILAPGLLALPAGAAAAAGTFQVLRGVSGRIVAAAVESL